MTIRCVALQSVDISWLYLLMLPGTVQPPLETTNHELGRLHRWAPTSYEMGPL